MVGKDIIPTNYLRDKFCEGDIAVSLDLLGTESGVVKR